MEPRELYTVYPPVEGELSGMDFWMNIILGTTFAHEFPKGPETIDVTCEVVEPLALPPAK